MYSVNDMLATEGRGGEIDHLPKMFVVWPANSFSDCP